MMFISQDRHWKVASVSLDGVPLLRVLHDTIAGIPLHSVGSNRMCTVQMAGGWFWAGDVRTPAEIERFVSLAELTEEG